MVKKYFDGIVQKLLPRKVTLNLVYFLTYEDQLIHFLTIINVAIKNIKRQFEYVYMFIISYVQKRSSKRKKSDF